ncbi:DUF6420 family protein [Streptomyces massasporeus]|uniref:DUF6420 family protein n=1 Tax=Streptomyces massasporeus TaxID=67324 RepID=UPI00382E98A0
MGTLRAQWAVTSGPFEYDGLSVLHTSETGLPLIHPYGRVMGRAAVHLRRGRLLMRFQGPCRMSSGAARRRRRRAGRRCAETRKGRCVPCRSRYPGFGPLAAGGHARHGGALQVDAVHGGVGERAGEVGGGVGAQAPVDDGV